jgi:SAM-dependent methyltransferase
VWLVHRVLEENVPLETALEEARKIGLRTPGYEERALAFIQKSQNGTVHSVREKSVRPGINDSFLKADLNPDDYIKRFEIESREIYSAREQVLKACGVKTGDRVADIGAGTGLYTRLFANQVGPDGWVYAVDISPRLVQHVMDQARVFNQDNVTGVLCPEDAVGLPPDSVDFAFVCDTYHHFEYPQSTLASIKKALKPGGEFVVIDFKRIEGVTRPWLMDHVRAGQEVFQSEIEKAGFQFVEEVQVPGLEENYFMKFQNPAE